MAKYDRGMCDKISGCMDYIEAQEIRWRVFSVVWINTSVGTERSFYFVLRWTAVPRRRRRSRSRQVRFFSQKHRHKQDIGFLKPAR